MISSNCTFKILDKVHIGQRVRMTSDRNTLPFNNEPLKNVEIVEYNSMGFKLKHPKLPKIVWVDFKQFPLTSLTIKNGIVEDEITFVENILNHEMEFIKTDMLDYIELMHIKNNEKAEQFSTITSIKPGEIVKSALCNGGADMIFLGVFHTKQIENKRSYKSSRGYSYEYDYKYYLSKNSPQRAIFLIKSKSLSYKESAQVAQETDYYEYSDYHDAKKNKNKKAYDVAAKDLLNIPVDRFKIVQYAVTSKEIKNVVKLNRNDSRFVDIESNAFLVLKETNEPTSAYSKYRNKPTYLEIKPRLNKELVLDFDTSSFIIVDSQRDNEDLHYIAASKKNLDENAVAYIKENYDKKLEPQIYK